MRLSTLCMATLLTFGAAGMAHATTVNLITNGDFSATSPTKTAPTQFSSGWTAGEFVTDWTGNGGYEIWYPNATAAVNTNAAGEYQGSGKEKLYGTLSSRTAANPQGVIPAPPGGPSFVGLDGDQKIAGVQSGISQVVTDLESGQTYTLTFEWGAAQLQSRTGPTTESLQVSLGGQTFTTTVLDNASEDFTGWYSQSFTFTANSLTGAGWNVLNFLSIGTPTNLPPVAVLADVSLTHDVPEPSDLAMFGGGLFGLGMLIVFARRRELRRREGDGDSAIV